MEYDLAVVIPGRNEEFISRTVDSVLKAIRGKTQIIVGLDEHWADPPIRDNKDVTVFYSNKSIGQRAITNKCAILARAHLIMKLDAHCEVSEGFDLALIKGWKELGDDVVQIPVLYNLHAFDWVCLDGHRRYQSPSGACKECGKPTTKDIVWKPRLNKKSEFYRFDTTLHFQYHSARSKRVPKDEVYVETMSAQGSCFVVTKKKYFEWNICDEKHGSWGNQGSEIACKAWLSGGRLVTNRNCWYSHMFRTQGADFGFPYPQSGKQVENAREYNRHQFLENTWEKQIYPLSWLIEKFAPLDDKDPKKPGDWHEPRGREVLEYVNKKGKEFYMKKALSKGKWGQMTNIRFFRCKHIPEGFEQFPCIYCNPEEVDNMFKPTSRPSKGIVYYTDNTINLKLGDKVRKQILKAGLPIVSVSLKPMKFGTNYVFKGERGYLAYHKQILMALEASNADIIYFCEHDVLYDPSHFDFTPPKKDVYYYDFNFWRVRASDRFAIHYDTHQVNLICAYRELLLTHYREKVKRIEATGFNMRMGFEPGCNRRHERIDEYKAESYYAKEPSIDIRHETNLTRSRWSKDQFRDQRNCQGWKEVRDVSEVSNLF